MVEDLIVILRRVEDPRDDNARHDLGELLFLALCGLLCGEKTCTDIADFAAGHELEFRDVLELRHGTPSHDTFSRVLRHLDPAALEQAFTACLRAMSAKLRQRQAGPGVLAVDGKSLRGAYETGQAYMPPLMVSLFDTQLRLSLAQTRAGTGGEAAAARALLAPLQAKGALVTGDALHCRPDTATLIHEAGADYVLAIKPNQPTLYAAAEAAFAKAQRPERWTSEDQGHGRCETRTAAVLPAPASLRAHLPHLAAFGQVTAVRRIGQQVEENVRYLALSRRLSARELAAVVRGHWGIENHLHGTLDVVFDEDRARTRKNYGPENWAILRRLARNILEACPEPIPIRKKMKRASWSKDFCFSLFVHLR